MAVDMTELALWLRPPRAAWPSAGFIRRLERLDRCTASI